MWPAVERQQRDEVEQRHEEVDDSEQREQGRDLVHDVDLAVEATSPATRLAPTTLIGLTASRSSAPTAALATPHSRLGHVHER